MKKWLPLGIAPVWEDPFGGTTWVAAVERPATDGNTRTNKTNIK